MKSIEFCDTKTPYFINTVDCPLFIFSGTHCPEMYESLNSLRYEILMADGYLANIQRNQWLNSIGGFNQFQTYNWGNQFIPNYEVKQNYNNLPVEASQSEIKHTMPDDLEIDKLAQFSNFNSFNCQTKESKWSDIEECDSCEPEHRMFWLWGLTKSQTLIWSKILTPNNIQYIEALKEFEYEIKSTVDQSSSKVSFTYICKHKSQWGKEFQRCWNLLDHCRTHKGIRPHKWNIWGKQFTQKGNLNKHLQIHS